MVTKVEKTKEKRELCYHYEHSLKAFARYLNPTYEYGEVHDDVFDLLQISELGNEQERLAARNQLFLLPRGHLKSHCLAVYCVWIVTRRPWATVIYLTAGEDLATVQMAAIKGMFDSKSYRLLWPEMFHEKESQRDKWSTWAINCDHPERARRSIRDYTVIIKTIGSSSTGLHCSDLIMDDVVTDKNAYTASGRKEVEDSVADFQFIKNAGANTKCAGTRYDERDAYASFEASMIPIFDEKTQEQIGEEPEWQVFKKEVEDKGDGTGNYLWPRRKSANTGEFYGMDFKELMRIKASLASLGKTAHFYAQYYNNPNKTGENIVSEFHYYSRKHLVRQGSKWFYGDKELAVVAGMDLAWTDETGRNGSRSDYTAIVVIGVDAEGFIYLLDCARFRTSKYSVYYRQIAQKYEFWQFRKIFMESESAGKLIVKEMQDRVRQDGLSLTVIGKSQSRKKDAKTEEHAAVLEPRYESGIIFHYKGGIVSELEEEVKSLRPKFDDLKDALTIAIKNSNRPRRYSNGKTERSTRSRTNNLLGARFGGRR